MHADYRTTRHEKSSQVSTYTSHAQHEDYHMTHHEKKGKWCTPPHFVEGSPPARVNLVSWLSLSWSLKRDIRGEVGGVEIGRGLGFRSGIT